MPVQKVDFKIENVYDNSNFLVAWEDSRNDVYTDIYFQDFNDEQIVDGIIKTRTLAEEKYNISSTPSLIINEKKYSTMSYENFEKIIESLIN